MQIKAGLAVVELEENSEVINIVTKKIATIIDNEWNVVYGFFCKSIKVNIKIIFQIERNNLLETFIFKKFSIQLFLLNFITDFNYITGYYYC